MNDIQSTEYTKVHSLISSHPGNHLYNQDNKHIHHPKSYLILPCNSFFFLLSRPPTPSYLTIICLFLSHLMYLHFLEFYVHIVSYATLFCWASFAWHTYLEIGNHFWFLSFFHCCLLHFITPLPPIHSFIEFSSLYLNPSISISILTIISLLYYCLVSLLPLLLPSVYSPPGIHTHPFKTESYQSLQIISLSCLKSFNGFQLHSEWHSSSWP